MTHWCLIWEKHIPSVKYAFIGGDSWRRTNRYNIYAKSGQSTWQKICDRSEINTYENLYYGEFTADEFAGITADYIKIEPVEIYDRKISEVDSAATAHIAEIEIFGKEMPAEGSRQAMTATDIRLDSDNKSVISNPNYPPAILSDGLFGNSQGSYAIYFGAANAQKKPSVVLEGEETYVTHIAVYAGVSGSSDMVDASGVKVYNYNKSTAEYEELRISWYDTVDNGTNTGLNNTGAASSARANQIVFLKLAEPVQTSKLKVQFNQAIALRVCEIETYYSTKNKLFGKAMVAFSPEYPTGNFGTNVINGGFVLTDGVNNDANGVKRWYVNETLGKDPYVEYNMNGEKINHIVIYSGSTQPVLRPDGATTRGGSVNPKYVDIKYTVDGSLWESVNFESIEEIELSGSKGCKLGISFTEIQPEKIRVCLKGDSMVSAAENNSLRVKEIEAYYDESINAEEFSRLDSCSIMGVKLT